MALIQISEPNSLVTKQVENYALGIDLGTTNSVVSCVVNGKAQILGPIIPSVYNDIRSIKRLMGTNEKVNLNGKLVSPVEISALILSSLKQQAEEVLGENVTKAVITVPAHFDDAARNDTKAAANIAGLEVLRLINEPTAAAIAYGLDSEAEGIYLIYDFGGGTFDVSILKMQKGVFQVIATGGDAHLGGDDIDYKIMEYLSLGKDQYLVARETKEALSNADCWNNLTKEAFENIAKPFIEKTIEICKSTIKDAKIDPALIKDIVLVGGSTRIPLVKQMLSDFLKKPLDNINPDLVVAMGAAVQADGLVHGADNLLLDVNSLSIGLEVMGGMNERIIVKNSPIPSSVTKYFTTYQDGQTGIIFHIVQGEREMVEDCRSLAKFELKGIPPMKSGMAKVAVTFTIDADGLLTISAQEETSNVKQKVEVKPSYGLSVDEIERMIEESYMNAKQDIDALTLAKAKLTAQGNVNNLEKAIDEDQDLITKSEKEELLSLIKNLLEVIKSDDLESIEKTNEDLETKSASFIQARINKKIKEALQGRSVDNF